MICWKCGNQIDEGSLFCPYCGSKQAQQSGFAAGQQQPQQNTGNGAPNRNQNRGRP